MHLVVEQGKRKMPENANIESSPRARDEKNKWEVTRKRDINKTVIDEKQGIVITVNI